MTARAHYTHDSPPLPRPSKVCDADRIECPRCGGVIRRVHAGAGSVIAKCEERLKVGPRQGDRCGAHVYFAGTEEGFGTVWSLSSEEYEYLAAFPALPRPRAVLELLKVLRRRDRQVPEARCTECHKPRKRYDLFEGVCRWCRGDAAEPEGAS